MAGACLQPLETLSNAASTGRAEGWRDTWPDLLAFALCLALAWTFRWQTTDLVWSLWLSSLLVGYSMIVWAIAGPVIMMARQASAAPAAARFAVDGVYAFGGLFMLAFFTVHFGGFHYVHSIFLNHFFPITRGKGFPGLGTYLEVLRRYWYFVPIAAVAERQAFRLPARPAFPALSAPVPDGPRAGRGGGIMEPYKNVIRMHMLIFFFAIAHFLRLENFGIYAVVYAVYFFPWRLVLGSRPAGAPSPG